MRVLVVGGGGREHTLAWACAKSPTVSHVYVAPGNAGTQNEPKCTNVDIAVNDFEGLLSFVRSNDVGLTIIGPEDPLVNGVKDVFAEQKLLCLGPSAGVAQLEGSKAFAKRFMEEESIPTAASFTTSHVAEAVSYIREQGTPIVVKADGLAAGKGVVICHSIEEAEATVTSMLKGERHGDAGRKVVLEEFMVGEEASFTVLVDGASYVTFASSQDHKPVGDGDTGPNTGGMGAYSPAPVITEEIRRLVLSNIVEPVIVGMGRRNTPYTGFLYVGLMITPVGEAKVVEFNCRFGDPETQVVLYRLKSDFAQLCLLAAQGKLHDASVENHKECALAVVMASGGYPGSYETGNVIRGLEQNFTDVKVFHAGTQVKDGEVRSSGGRVLGVTSLGDSVAEAQRKAYAAVDEIHWDNAYFRQDIGFRAIDRD